jgi:SAM-dependent methyltransferase
VDRLRDELGLRAFSGSLPHPALENASFDVITMWQSLEHVHQPLDVLRAANQILAPGGTLIVAVPNIDSLAFRWFGSAWSGLDLPRHLVHFTPETLRLMLGRAGFEARRVCMARRGGWLRASARLATHHFPHQTRWFRWLQRKSMSNFASWFGYWTGQADCLMVTATRKKIA